MQEGTSKLTGAFLTTLKLFIVTGLMLLTPGLQPALLAQAQADPSGHAAALERLEETMSLVERLQATLDRRLFDMDALTFELAFEEPEGIRDWLHAHVAYQPYGGVLRGAEGTLYAGAGNSFDQSLLLETMLNSAGYDTRIVIGELSQDDARRMLAIAAAAPDDGAWREAAGGIVAELDGLVGEPGLDYAAIAGSLRELLEPAAIDEAVFARAEQAAWRLTEAVEASGIELGAGGALEELLAAAAEHAWVEYRLGESHEWTPLSISLPAGMVLPEPHTVLADAVPSEYVHRLRIEAFAESKEGDNFTVSPVMGRWEQPTAYLSGELVTYSSVPNGLLELGAEADIEAVLEASEFFFPFINGSLAAGGQTFDLEGAVVSPLVATDQAAGVFREVRGGFMDALGALGGLGASDDEEPDVPLALTSFWLEYTLIGPGEVEQTHTRTLFDRIGADGRAAGSDALAGHTREEAELALMREERLMAITGEYRAEWVLDEFFTRFLNTRSFLEYVLALHYGVDTDITLEQAIETASPLEHLLASQAFDAPAQREGILSYRAEPTLLVFGSGLTGTRQDSVVQSSIDIVSNARVTLAQGNEGVDARSGVLLGVWETYVENEIQAAHAAESGATLFSAAQSIAAALADGSQLLVLEPGDDPRASGMTGTAAQNAARDLSAGYLVVVPEATAGQERTAWWRVEAAGGEALGITSDGRGQAMTEYLIELADDVATIIFAVKGLAECTDSYASGSPAQACCLMKAHLNNVAGMGLGSVLGGAFAMSAGSSLMLNLFSGVVSPDMIGGATGLDCGAFA